MLARFVLGAVTAGAVVVPALAGQMNAEEARKFVAGKVFAFTCFDGTRGAGRVLDDMGATGAVQFSGSGPIRRVRLPGNTLQIRGQAVCASLKGLPFEPCFNLDKKDELSFRGSVSGMGFAYCDFHHQGAAQMLMPRAVARAPRGGVRATPYSYGPIVSCLGSDFRSSLSRIDRLWGRLNTWVQRCRFISFGLAMVAIPALPNRPLSSRAAKPPGPRWPRFVAICSAAFRVA